MLGTWEVYLIYFKTFQIYQIYFSWELAWLFDNLQSPTANQNFSFWYIHFQAFLGNFQFSDR